ncbi:hypothetical protein AB0K68_33540 [Streptomyces sp. NPDC050698]
MPDGTRSAHTAARSPAGALPAALVLALLAILGIATASPAPSGTVVAGAPVAADHHRYDGTRADDGCDAVCVVRAATRLEPHSEHPAPRGHLGTCGRSVRTPPCRAARPYRAPAGQVPSSQPHTVQDQGRAPPVCSGT